MSSGGAKLRAAALSVISNSTLILLKAVAASITGSVAILTEAVHSSIDLVASIVAFASVRKAGEPADESHRYGHERFENLAAAFEGILILVGSAVISFEAIRRLISPGHLESLPVGWPCSTIRFERIQSEASIVAPDLCHVLADDRGVLGVHADPHIAVFVVGV